MILPTFKRAESAKQCLATLQAQTFSDFEVIVVDNADEVEVRQMVEESSATAKFSLRYISEPRLGLHYARHAGARASKGEILVFTDDDATTHHSWLETYAHVFKHHPEIVGATGPARPVWEVPAPTWVLDMIDENGRLGFLSLVGEGDTFFASPRQEFHGVNMAIRQDALFSVGGFNPDSYGDIWLGDGETGLSHKVHKRGWLIAYVPEAIVWHHIPAQRLTAGYYRKRIANQGAADVYSRFNRRLFSRFQLLLFAGKIAAKYWPFWLIDSLVRGKTDSRSLKLQLRAVATWARVAYTLRLLFNGELRQVIQKNNWIDYGPAC